MSMTDGLKDFQLSYFNKAVAQGVPEAEALENAKKLKTKEEAKEATEALGDGLNNNANWGVGDTFKAGVGSTLGLATVGTALHKAGGAKNIFGKVGEFFGGAREIFSRFRGKGALATAATVVVGAAGIASLSSCVKEDNLFLKVENNNQALIEEVQALRKEVEGLKGSVDKNTEAVLAMGDKIATKIDELMKGNAENKDQLITELRSQLSMVLDMIAEGNAFLKMILDESRTNNKQNEEILEQLKQMRNDINNLTNIVSSLPDEIKAKLGPDLQAIIDAINNNTTITQQEFAKLRGQMHAIIQRMNTLIKNVDSKQAAMIQQLCEIIKRLGGIQVSIDEIKSGISQLLDQGNTIINQISTLINNTDEISDKIDTTNKYLEAIYILLQGMDGSMKKNFEAVLQAIFNNGCKLEDLKGLLNIINNNITDQGEKVNDTLEQILKAINRMNGDMKTKLTQILGAIMKNGCKLDDLAGLLEMINENIDTQGGKVTELLDKIYEALGRMDERLANKMSTLIQATMANGCRLDGLLKLMTIIDNHIKMDFTQDKANTQAIIDAINGLYNVIGNNSEAADLSKVEAMLATLIGLMRQNNGLLSSMNLELKAIFDKIPEVKDYSAQLDKIFNAIINFKLPQYDDTKLMALLNKILEAIKNHKVDVNVIVELINKANDGNHEGIVGEIESLIS